MTPASHEKPAREAPDDPIVSLVERNLDGVPEPASRGETLAVWEMRASATTRDGEPAILDGGSRVERRAAEGTGPTSAAFAAGAGPASLSALARVELDPDPDGWRAIGREVAARVEAARARVELACSSATRDLATTPGEMPVRLVVEARARVRALRRDGRGAFEITLEESLRVAALSPRRGRPLAECLLDGLILSEARLRDALSGVLAVARASHLRLAETHAAVAAPTRRAGPVVLLPAAAAWWVHELSHAAFEDVGTSAAAASRPARIVEDPASAPWPAGFATDDLGDPARKSVLWGGRGEGKLDAGHARRASIRDEAVPGPAVTRLESDARRETPLADVPDGTRVVTSARAGRLDPLAGIVLLHVDGLGVLDAGEILACSGEGVLTISVEAGWQGAQVLTGGPPPTLVSALCTRQGRATPVMVGAPTVLLDPVRFTTA